MTFKELKQYSFFMIKDTQIVIWQKIDDNYRRPLELNISSSTTNPNLEVIELVPSDVGGGLFRFNLKELFNKEPSTIKETAGQLKIGDSFTTRFGKYMKIGTTRGRTSYINLETGYEDIGLSEDEKVLEKDTK